MRRESLTRYYPPYVRGQQGSGLTEDMVWIATSVVLESVRAGQSAATQGASWQATGQAAGQALKQGLKRKTGAMGKAGLKAGGRATYKKLNSPLEKFLVNDEKVSGPVPTLLSSGH